MADLEEKMLQTLKTATKTTTTKQKQKNNDLEEVHR